jgi:hypothetical protein
MAVGMMEYVTAAQAWVMGLGAQYGVNPLIFGAIYVGAIPFFLFFTGLSVKRLRNRQGAVMPIMAAGLCFVSAYIYLAFVGRGIPAWVWVFLGVIIAYGAWNAVKNFRAKLIAK